MFLDQNKNQSKSYKRFFWFENVKKWELGKWTVTEQKTIEGSNAEIIENFLSGFLDH